MLVVTNCGDVSSKADTLCGTAGDPAKEGMPGDASPSVLADSDWRASCSSCSSVLPISDSGDELKPSC